MIDTAVAKINAELQASPNDTYLGIVGHYIILRCTDDIAAAKISADGKSLRGAWEAILANAKKAAKDNMAVMSSEVVFDTADSYFDLTRNDRVRESAARHVCGDSTIPQPAVRPALDLTDFL